MRIKKSKITNRIVNYLMDLPVAFCYNKRDDEKIGAKFDFREGKTLENRKKKNPFKMNRNECQLFIIACMMMAFLIVFSFVPMFGVLLAFRDGDRKLNVLNVIFSGEWVGLENFSNVLQDYNFKRVLLNTLGLNILMLIVNFPGPILFALFLNEIKQRKVRAALQSVAIFPHFLSWIIFGGIILALTDMDLGVVNPILNALGLSSEENPVNLGEAKYSWFLIIFSSLIKGVGWGSIIYTAAIAGIDKNLYEAAEIDGANRWRKMQKITFPMILPTVTVFLLLNISGLLGNSYEQIYVFQNGVNLAKTEVIATYSVKVGVSQRRYSFTSALGLMNSLIGMLLLFGGNFISKKLTGRGLYE